MKFRIKGWTKRFKDEVRFSRKVLHKRGRKYTLRNLLYDFKDAFFDWDI